MTQSTEFNDLNALYEQLDAQTSPAAERRQHPRTFAKGHVPASVEVPGSAPVIVSIRDLSRSGVGIFSPHAIKLQAQVVVSFRLGARPVRATCKVVNCREHEGRFVVGMAFVEVKRPPADAPPSGSVVAKAAAPQGEMESTTEAARGADLGRVDDVVRRLSQVLKTPN